MSPLNARMVCPVPGCGEVCNGLLALQRHQSDFHSHEEIEAARRDTEAVETEALNGEIRRQERLDNFIEFGG